MIKIDHSIMTDENTQQHVSTEPAIDELKEHLQKCEEERAEYLNGWQRAKADYINYKKEETHRLEDVFRSIAGTILSDILPVLDSFDLALETGDRNVEIKESADQHGMLLIRAQLFDVLKNRGLEIIAINKGHGFNPERHEALGEVECDLPEGTIYDEVQKGYMLNGKVIRPARVRLAKSK